MEALLAVIGGIIGYALRAGQEIFLDTRKAQREDERELAKQQRETLLDLQDNIQHLGRVAGHQYFLNDQAFRQSGTWEMQDLPEDMTALDFNARGEVIKLESRVLNQRTRDLVHTFRHRQVEVMLAQSQPAAATSAILQLREDSEACMEQIGELLRGNYRYLGGKK
jgi:hypothetical protein